VGWLEHAKYVEMVKQRQVVTGCCIVSQGHVFTTAVTTTVFTHGMFLCCHHEMKFSEQNNNKPTHLSVITVVVMLRS